MDGSVTVKGGAIHGVWRCQSRPTDGSVKALGGVGHGLGRCQSLPKGVSATACGVPPCCTFSSASVEPHRVRWLTSRGPLGPVTSKGPLGARTLLRGARRGGSGQTGSRRAVLAMLLLAPRPRHALDATDGPLRGFGCAVSQAGALPMDMQDSTAELLAMGPDVLKVLLHTPLPRLIAQGPSRLFCAAGRSLPGPASLAVKFSVNFPRYCRTAVRAHLAHFRTFPSRE